MDVPRFGGVGKEGQALKMDVFVFNLCKKWHACTGYGAANAVREFCLHAEHASFLTVPL
jgi:hypothetical protein